MAFEMINAERRFRHGPDSCSMVQQPASQRSAAGAPRMVGLLMAATAAAPTSSDEFLTLVRQSGLADPDQLAACVARARRAANWSDDPNSVAALLLCESILTLFQAEQLLQGRHRGFFLGDYRLL